MTDRTNTFGGRGESSAGDTGHSDSRAHELKDQVQETAAHVASEVKDRGEHMLDEGKEKARELGDRAGEIARSQTDEQRQRVADGVRSFAEALRRGADGLPPERRQYERYIDDVADRVESVSRYLDERDVSSLTHEARRFARDHTPLFLSGAFTLGVLGARFIKSSGDEAREIRQDDSYRRELPSTRFDRPESSEEARMYGRAGPDPEEGGYA